MVKPIGPQRSPLRASTTEFNDLPAEVQDLIAARLPARDAIVFGAVGRTQLTLPAVLRQRLEIQIPRLKSATDTARFLCRYGQHLTLLEDLILPQEALAQSALWSAIGRSRHVQALTAHPFLLPPGQAVENLEQRHPFLRCLNLALRNIDAHHEPLLALLQSLPQTCRRVSLTFDNMSFLSASPWQDNFGQALRAVRWPDDLEDLSIEDWTLLSLPIWHLHLPPKLKKLYLKSESFRQPLSAAQRQAPSPPLWSRFAATLMDLCLECPDFAADLSPSQRQDFWRTLPAGLTHLSLDVDFFTAMPADFMADSGGQLARIKEFEISDHDRSWDQLLGVTAFARAIGPTLRHFSAVIWVPSDVNLEVGHGVLAPLPDSLQSATFYLDEPEEGVDFFEEDGEEEVLARLGRMLKRLVAWLPANLKELTIECGNQPEDCRVYIETFLRERLGAHALVVK